MSFSSWKFFPSFSLANRIMIGRGRNWTNLNRYPIKNQVQPICAAFIRSTSLTRGSSSAAATPRKYGV
ncbi:hypothetical protein D3C76_1827950 [compost metagenome]